MLEQLCDSRKYCDFSFFSFSDIALCLTSTRKLATAKLQLECVKVQIVFPVYLIFIEV